MRSYVARTKVASSLGPDQFTAAANGTGVDLLGFDANVIGLNTGAFGGTSPAASYKIQESSDNSTWSDCADAVLEGVTGNAAGVALAASTIKAVGYVGLKRFVRIILASVTGTTPVIRFDADVIRQEPKQTP